MNKEQNKEQTSKRIKLIVKLGEKAYHNYRNNIDISEELAPIIEEIKVCDAEISKDSKYYMPSLILTSCPECNLVVDQDSLFCCNCGYNLCEYISKFTKKCENCESFLKEEYDFCPLCGSKNKILGDIDEVLQ